MHNLSSFRELTTNPERSLSEHGRMYNVTSHVLRVITYHNLVII